MGAFWTDAEGLFETARQATQSGSEDCDWAILIGRQGQIRMLPAEGWAWPSLVAHYGGETTYRVTREHGRVRVEGCAGTQSCRLEYASPAAQARQLLGAIRPPVLPAMPSPKVEPCKRLM